MKALLGLLAALGTFIGTMTLTIFLEGWIVETTHSSPIGICGPYGDGQWVMLECVLFVAGLIGGIALAVKAFRACAKSSASR